MTSPTGARPAPDTEMTDLVALYARHAPDLERMPGDAVPLLLAAARSHLQLASWRTSREPLIRVYRPDADAEQKPDDAGTNGSAGALVVEIVTDDMPFLVESVQAAAVRAGCEVQRVIHPIVVVRRTDSGDLAEVLTAADPADPPPGTLAESWIHLDLEPAPVRPADLEAALGQVLRDVRTIVEDGQAMVTRACELADALPTEPVVAGGTRPADVAELLRWLADGHFTFVGYCYYAAATTGDTAELRPDPSTGLGALGPKSSVSATFVPRVDTVDDLDDVLVITRANAISPLRAVHPYYLAVRTVEPGGRLVGEHRFLGTLTVSALYESVLDIPVVEARARAAIHSAGFPLESYSGQAMLEVISGLPREELFSASEQTLHDTAVGVLAMAGRRAVRLFLRPDPYRRFISALVYLPRDRYTTESRLAMAEVLRQPARRPLRGGHRAGLRIQPGPRPVHRAHRTRRFRLRG